MKKALSLLLALGLCLGLMIPVGAATDEAVEAANRLNTLGLFSGVGTNEDGTPNYDLDRAPTRAEAITMLVKLLGKDAAAKGSYSTPFADVPDWAKGYVGYAYQNKLTAGTSTVTFGSDDAVTAAQYLTFVLRALGYEVGTDFQWDSAWTLSDELGLTAGQYTADSAFTRGDVVVISSKALDLKLKGQDKTLLTLVEESLKEAEQAEPPASSDSGVTAEDATVFIRGEMDCAYLGKTTPEYLAILEMTQAEAMEYHDWNVSEEARIFLEYVSCEYPTEKQVERTQKLIREIYSHSKYEVAAAEKIDDKTFAAQVKIQPIDIMMQIKDEQLQEIWDSATKGVDSATVTDAEYEKLDQKYIDGVLDLLESLIPKIGYEKEQTCTLRLILDETDNAYYMSDDDWNNMDYMIIDYDGSYAG